MLCVKIIKIFLINLYIQATIFFCGVKNERKNKLEGYIYAEHRRYKEKNNHADRTDERKGP